MGRHQQKVPEVLQRFGRRLKGFPVDQSARIYFLVERNEVVYVGKTTRLFRRLHNHLSSNKKFSRVFYIDVDPDDLDEVERELIGDIRPPLNAKPKYFDIAPGMCFGPLKKTLGYFAPPRKRHDSHSSCHPELTAGITKALESQVNYE